jgi:hypothetical protein
MNFCLPCLLFCLNVWVNVWGVGLRILVVKFILLHCVTKIVFAFGVWSYVSCDIWKGESLNVISFAELIFRVMLVALS